MNARSARGQLDAPSQITGHFFNNLDLVGPLLFLQSYAVLVTEEELLLMVYRIISPGPSAN